MESSERHVPDRAEPAVELAGAGTDSRRRFLARAGLGGLAITIGSVLVPFDDLLTPASAAPAGNPDDAVAAFAQSIELALSAGYDYALATKTATSDRAIAALMTFGAHHKDHASAFGSQAGAAAKGKANAKLLDVINGQFQAANNENALLQAAYNLENAATATHLSFLAELKDTAKVQLVASILPVESQHATDLGLLLNKDPASVVDFLPSFATQDAAFLPKLYPTPTA